MGLPPTQGNNNLRLTSTANFYQNYNRLATNTTTTTRKTCHKPYESQLHSHLHVRLGSIKSPNSIKSPKCGSARRRSTQIDQTRTNSRSTTNDYYLARSRPVRMNDNTVDRRTVLRPLTSRSNAFDNVRRYRIADNSYASIYGRAQMDARRKASREIVSNMPLMNVNSSIFMVNHSPFGLRDPRFGIFHHCSQSVSYY